MISEVSATSKTRSSNQHLDSRPRGTPVADRTVKQTKRQMFALLSRVVGNAFKLTSVTVDVKGKSSYLRSEGSRRKEIKERTKSRLTKAHHPKRWFLCLKTRGNYRDFFFGPFLRYLGFSRPSPRERNESRALYRPGAFLPPRVATIADMFRI